MKAILIAVLAGLCWGIGEVFTKSVLHTGRIGPITAIAVRSSVALPIMWCVYVIWVHAMQHEPRDWWRADSATLAKLILGSGLIAGAAGMIFFYFALSVGELSRIKPIAFTIAPATAVLLGWLILGETMTARKLIAIALILSGIILLTGRQTAAANPNHPDAEADEVGRLSEPSAPRRATYHFDAMQDSSESV